jgi:hypothetical protein
VPTTQLQALNKAKVQQRKRTIDETTRMAGKSFVSGHVDPKIQRTIEDMAPLLHKPEAQTRDPTDVEAYLEDCRQQLVMHTITTAQYSAKRYSDDAFEDAMQRDWQTAQRRLLEDLAGDATPFDASGGDGFGGPQADGGAGAMVPFGQGGASEAELRKIARYVEAVAGISSRPQANLREKVGDLFDACDNCGAPRTEAEARMYTDLWKCLHSLAETTVNQEARVEQGDNQNMQSMLHGCTSFLEKEYKEHLERECSRMPARGYDPAFEFLAAQFLESLPSHTTDDDDPLVEVGVAGSRRRCPFWGFAYLCVRCAAAGGTQALRKTLANRNNAQVLEQESIVNGKLWPIFDKYLGPGTSNEPQRFVTQDSAAIREAMSATASKDIADSFKGLLLCIFTRHETNPPCSFRRTFARFGYKVEDYMWHKLSTLTPTPRALAEFHDEIAKHLHSFPPGVKEKVLILSLQFRRLIDHLRPASAADSTHLALALSWIGGRATASSSYGDDAQIVAAGQGQSGQGQAQTRIEIGKLLNRYVDHTFLRSRDANSSFGVGLQVGDTPQIRYRNAVMYLGLISDVKVRDEFLKKLVFTAGGHPDLIGDPDHASGRGGGAAGQLVEVLRMEPLQVEGVVRGAALIAQQKAYWDLAYQLYCHIQHNEDAELILEEQLRRLLMQETSEERARWVEYAQSHIQATAARSGADGGGGSGGGEHGGSGASADRKRRLRLLVAVADFFSAYAAKETGKALAVLDSVGVLGQHGVERLEVTCPPDKRPGNIIHVADRIGQMHAVTVPPGVQQGQSFPADVPSSGGPGGSGGGTGSGALAEQLVREMPAVLDAALRCIVREHARLSEAEPQARAWQQQEQRGEMMPLMTPAMQQQRQQLGGGGGGGGGGMLLPSAGSGYEVQRQKLRAQFGTVRQHLDMKGVQIAHELQLEIRNAGLI